MVSLVDWHYFRVSHARNSEGSAVDARTWIERADKDSTNRHKVYQGHELKFLLSHTGDRCAEARLRVFLRTAHPQASQESLGILYLTEAVRAPRLAEVI